MNTCINTSSAEFRSLKERSGLSEFQLKVGIRAYQNEHGDVWPKLDELPNANSEEYLKESLKIREDGSTKIKTILDVTNTNSVEEATVRINDQYRDLYTEILPLNEDAIVTIEQRPSPFRLIRGEQRDLSDVNSTVFIGLALERLALGYGILVINMTTRELKDLGILDLVPEGVFVSAFVLDGNIIVNTDVASVDAPVHELMHILMGSIKYTLPDLYYNLVQTARELPSYEERIALYPHRALSDLDEEVFVEEYAKYLTGMKNGFENLDPEVNYLLNYEISRTLDTILNGDNSVRVIPEAMRFGTTLRNLGKMVNSKNMESKFLGYADSAYISRVIGNIKEDLFKSNKLEEIC